METGKLICVVLIIVALFLFATSLHRVYKVKSLEGFTTSVTQNYSGRFIETITNADGTTTVNDLGEVIGIKNTQDNDLYLFGKIVEVNSVPTLKVVGYTQNGGVLENPESKSTTELTSSYPDYTDPPSGQWRSWLSNRWQFLGSQPAQNNLPDSTLFSIDFTGSTTQAGTTQAGTTQAGTTAAGTTQAGTTQAGTTAAGTTAAGTTAAGTPAAIPAGLQLLPEDIYLLDKLRHHEGLVEKLNSLNSDELEKIIEITGRTDTGNKDAEGNPIMEESLLNQIYNLKDPIKDFSDNKDTIYSAISAYADLTDDQKARLESIESGLTSYKEFHDEYNQKLHNMLDNKFSKSSSEFLSLYDLNKTKIQNLKGKIDELRDETNRELTSNNTISIKNLDNGERLNLKKIKQNDDDARTDAQRYLIFANNNCLSFNGPREYGLKQCEMTDQSQHFLIDNIKNNQEYEVPINIIRPDGVKKEVTEFDEVSYDFNLIYPYNSVGSCLQINDGNIKFVPCSIENNQRFNVSDRVSVEQCN